MCLLNLKTVTVIISLLQMRKQRFTEVKHYYKLQGYFNRTRRNKAIIRRIPFVSRRLCLMSHPQGGCPARMFLGLTQPSSAVGAGGKWYRGPRMLLRTIGWQLVKIKGFSRALCRAVFCINSGSHGGWHLMTSLLTENCGGINGKKGSSKTSQSRTKPKAPNQTNQS